MPARTKEIREPVRLAGFEVEDRKTTRTGEIPRNASGGIQYGKVRDTPARDCPGCGESFHPSRKQILHSEHWQMHTGTARAVVCSHRCAGRMRGWRKRAGKVV